MSKTTANRLGLDTVDSDQIAVRLADGKTVTTASHTTTAVHLNSLIIELRFELLNAEVTTILGMPFLEAANPQINWKAKSVKIKHRGKLINIPTL